MPHTRNRMKLRGDIHPPEVEYDLSTNLDDDYDDDLQAEAPRLDDIDLRAAQPMEPALVMLAAPDRLNAGQRAQQLAVRQLANRPMLVVLGAFAIGAAVAHMLKKGVRAL